MFPRIISRNLRQTINVKKTLGIRSFHKSLPILKFELEKETKCRELLDKLPSFEYIFQNADGSKRTPSDEELKSIAYLNSFAGSRKLGLSEALFSFPKEYEELYLKNDQDLEKLKASSALIIDKIPYEDTATGEIKWQIVREGDEKEGWENIAHTLFVPACVLLLIVLIWRDDMDVTEWAKRELLYRVKQDAEAKGDSAVLEQLNKYGKPDGQFDFEGFSKDDDIVVERILSGDYDRLSQLKINQQKIKSEA
ncbi:hypothetical protein BVG19_g977 [[Candida] boidinii]|nr:hypothetical protein BVG19_g977 [[Candida] boidinii]OWB50558.1 hypothetical protein B5S27_g2109 [[Candida] boidinii]